MIAEPEHRDFLAVTDLLPVMDLHCDLLAYMANIDGADPMSSEIGCALPLLQAGNVRFQTLAIFAITGEGSVESGIAQAAAFEELLEEYSDSVQPFDSMGVSDLADTLDNDDAGSRVTIITAIENASAFCSEDDDIDDGFDTLETMITMTAPLLYISLTHNEENRFGGGNFSDNVGLKPDGEVLLEFLSGRNVAVDLSHTSDALARDILEYLDARRLDVPVIASHSNFRTVYDHVRNLPDDIAKEIIARGGLIGINFCREFLDDEDSDVLIDHIVYGIEELGGSSAIAFGSDFFYTPDDSEFFYEHRSAAQFPTILHTCALHLRSDELHNLAFGNVRRFLRRLWEGDG
jgi:microsomal dipeptidase-like Zn-dependent dipeptidase